MSYKYVKTDAAQIDANLKAILDAADADNNGQVVYIENGVLAFDTYESLFTVEEFSTEEYLPYSNLTKIMAEASYTEFPSTDLSVSKWGDLTINNTRTGTKVYVENNAVVTAECSVTDEYLSYGLPQSNMPMTGYAVSKGSSGSCGRIFGVTDSQYATKGWKSSWVYQYSNGDTTTSTSVDTDDFHVLAYRVNNGAASLDFFIDGAQVGSLSISSIGQTMRFGCVDGGTMYDGTTYHKFFGIVAEAESDSVIAANTANLKTKFNLT